MMHDLPRAVLAAIDVRDPLLEGHILSGEGAVYGRRIAKTRPKAKVAALYEDSEYGKDLLAGVKRGLGSRAAQIVSTQTYEPSDITVSSQVSKARFSGLLSTRVKARDRSAGASARACSRPASTSGRSVRPVC